MKDKLDLLCYSLIILFAVILIAHFSLIYFFGAVLHYEDNMAILFSELGLSVVLLGFGVGRYVNYIQRFD